MTGTLTSHDIVPGTIHLVDISGEQHGSHVVLQPTPSTDPEDPLNWSRGRKQLAIWMVYSYVFAIGIATAVQYSVLTQISDDTGITVGQLNLGTGLMFLFSGWTNLLWQPIAWAYGRRGVYVVSCILSIAPMVWAPFSSGAHVWYAHRILLGIFVAPVESLPEVSVPDLFFAHERGSFMALYAFILFGSNFLAPFFAGFIEAGVGWKWVMYFGALVLAADAILIFFFMEDTIYFRKTAEGTEPEQGDQHSSSEELQEGADGKDYNDKSTTIEPSARDIQTGESPKLARTYWQKLSLITLLPDRPSPLQVLQQSWRALTILVYFPIIVWAGLLYGTCLAWYNVLNATMSSILGAEPYNFPATMVGVAYLSPIVASAIACFLSGWGADKFMLVLAKRNKGVREPEQRLWTLLISAVLSSAGLILWGVGASQGIHFMGLIIGLGMVTFGVICGGSIALAYAVDCFKDIAGESMISVVLIRNTLGFAFNYAVTPWIETDGQQNCFIGVAMLALVCTMSFLVMVVFGKSLRRFSAKKYWQYVEDGRSVSSH